MVFCIIFKNKKHVYRPPKCCKKINKMACQGHFLHFYPSSAIFGHPGVPRAVKIRKILLVKESSWFLVPYSIIKNLCFDLFSSEKKKIKWLVGPIFQCCNNSKRPIPFLHVDMQLLDFGLGSGRLNA